MTTIESDSCLPPAGFSVTSICLKTYHVQAESNLLGAAKVMTEPYNRRSLDETQCTHRVFHIERLVIFCSLKVMSFHFISKSPSLQVVP
jgi:hypothetical protein